MTSDEVMRLAREAGVPVGFTAGNPTLRQIQLFADLVEQHCKRIYGEPTKLYAMPELLAEAGYRKCAEGQGATQYCALAEQARREEREAIAKMFDGRVWAFDYREIAAAIRARGKDD